jgi:LEA14-like dessication related protein
MAFSGLAARVLSGSMALLLVACTMVKAPEVVVRDVRLAGSDLLEVELAILNPNRLAVRIADFSYTVRVESNAVGSGTRGEVLTLPARDTARAVFPLKIDYPGLARSLPMVFSESISVGIDGDYALVTRLGRRKFGLKAGMKLAPRSFVKSALEGLFEE